MSTLNSDPNDVLRAASGAVSSDSRLARLLDTNP
jgi:hypothetical protein